MRIKIIITIILLLMISYGISAQQNIIILNKKNRDRPPVKFPHKLHISIKIKCEICHHQNSETNSNYSNCISCHDNRLTTGFEYKDIFHILCINCHKNNKSSKLKTGPILCGKCHMKNNTNKIK